MLFNGTCQIVILGSIDIYGVAVLSSEAKNDTVGNEIASAFSLATCTIDDISYCNRVFSSYNFNYSLGHEIHVYLGLLLHEESLRVEKAVKV